MDNIIKKLFTKKVLLIVKLTMVVLTLTLLIVLIMSVSSTHGNYIFEVGTSSDKYPKDTIKPPSKTPTFSDATLALFDKRTAIIGNALWGGNSAFKIEIFMAGIAFVASIFQMTRWFKEKYSNFVSSVIIATASILSFAFGSNAANLSIGLITAILGAYAVSESILVQFKKFKVL